MTSRVGQEAECASPTGNPSASSVSVATPSRTSASYDLSLPERNRASRVARPTTSGSTPVASGSSVPVWPIRRSRSARRTRATTSCDVGPTGLSMTSRPSINGALDLLDEDLLQRVDTAARRASGGVLVPAAAELLRDRGDIDLALRPHADAIGFALNLLEEDDGLDLLDRQRQVDQPFGVLVGAARGPRHLVIEVDDGDASGRIDLHRAQHAAEQLQPPHVVAVVHVACDEHRI